MMNVMYVIVAHECVATSDHLFDGLVCNTMSYIRRVRSSFGQIKLDWYIDPALAGTLAGTLVISKVLLGGRTLLRKRPYRPMRRS